MSLSETHESPFAERMMERDVMCDCGSTMWLTLHQLTIDDNASRVTRRFECIQCGNVSIIGEKN